MGGPSKYPYRAKSAALGNKNRFDSRNGAIPRAELGSVVGRLSFSRSSIFGRFGRPFLSPLYAKVNGPYYRHLLSGRALRCLRRWSANLRAMAPRAVRPISGNAEFVVSTDAGPEGGIIAAMVFIRRKFKLKEEIEEVWDETAGLLIGWACSIRPP